MQFVIKCNIMHLERKISYIFAFYLHSSVLYLYKTNEIKYNCSTYNRIKYKYSEPVNLLNL